MIIVLQVSLIIGIAAFIGYQVYSWKQFIAPMSGMMIAMTIAMMVSLTVGITASLNIFSDPTIATIFMIVLGVFCGYIIGYPFGILAQLDGVLAGIMGGLMGPMTGLMVNNSHPDLFIGFFTLLYAFTTLLIYQLIQQAVPSTEKNKISGNWFMILPLCILLPTLSIFQTSMKPRLHSDSIIKSEQNKEYQEVVIQVNANGYSPANVSLKAGIPTKLHFRQNTDSGCLSILSIKDLGIKKELEKGDNVIIFTPKKLGKMIFTCGMGMYQGSLTIK
jgi:hypothetical protein